MHDGESARGQALSAVSPGQIIITDPAHQTQNLENLRRDTSNTNTSLPGIPELQDILREQLETQELYQDAAAKAAKFIGDFALKRRQAATTDEERAFWAEGGPGPAALHALAGGLLGGVTDVSGMIRGALGGATSSLLGPHIRDLVAEIVNGTSLAGTAQGEQLINIISASLVQGLAASVSGGEGAAYAGYAFKYNYITHREFDEYEKKLSECQGDSSCEERVEAQRAADWASRQGRYIEACRSDAESCRGLLAKMEIDLALLQENSASHDSAKAWLGADIAGLLSLQWTMLEQLAAQGKLSSAEQLKLNEYRVTPLSKLVEALTLAIDSPKPWKRVQTIGGKTCVYSCEIDGTVRYVGITDDVARRGIEHLRSKEIVIREIPGLSNLSRQDARAVEQTLINYYGLEKNGGTLINKINSISAIKNPTAYERALIKGATLLRNAKYPGF
jgi:filamentous hemagglutinin